MRSNDGAEAMLSLQDYPPRSLLFLPADRLAHLLPKAEQAQPDAIIIDLEDSILPDHKAQCRDALSEARASGPTSRPLFVRVNGVGTPWFEADVRSVARLPGLGLVLPKCESAQEVRRAADIWKSETSLPLRLVPLLESARGIIGARRIASAHAGVLGLALGAEDIAAQIGLRRSKLGLELLYARSHVVISAFAAQRWAIDTPSLELRRLEVVRREATIASHLGFAGKLVVHPAQVKPVHAAFRPTPQEVEHASRVVRAAEMQEAVGAGVGRGRDRMFDKAVIAQAHRILRRAGSPARKETEDGG